MAASRQIFFPSQVPLELTSSFWRAAVSDDSDILGLLIWLLYLAEDIPFLRQDDQNQHPHV